MSTVVGAIEDSFKQLVDQKPYRSITVKEICEGAFISRRTFYANFTDKRAVVAYLFRRDAIDPVRRVLQLLSAEEALGIAPAVFSCFYDGIHNHRTYYYNLVRPMCGVDSTFELVVSRAVRKVVEEAVLKRHPTVDRDLLYYGSYYHAAAQAIFLEKWISDNCEPSADQIAEYQASIVVPSLARMAGIRLSDV